MAQIIDAEPNISKRANAIYADALRDQVETDDNIGKILVLDVGTGNYEIDADGIIANNRLRAKYPATNSIMLFAIRIGYDAVYSFGGAGIQRTSPPNAGDAKGHSAQRREWLDGSNQKRGVFNMTTTLAEVQKAASNLLISEQLELAAYICEHVRQAVPAPAPTEAKFSMEEYLARCDALAEQIEGEFDSVEDMHKIREERMAGIE